MSKADNSSLIKGTGVVGALTLLSRVAGFVRDLIVARQFGAGLYADAFNVAFRIPNLLRSLVGEGALTSAFVPIFSGELQRGSEHARSALSLVSAFLVALTALLTLLGIIFAPHIVDLFAPGFGVEAEKRDICILLTRLMLPYIMFVSLVAMLGGALNTIRIFGTTALAQVIMNLALIAGAVCAAFFDQRQGVIILAVSVLAGGALQVAAQVPALRRGGLAAWPKLKLTSPIIGDLLKLMLPATLGAAVYQISIFINTLFASLLESGSVTWLFYADRLTQLPLGIFSIALASVLLPTLSTAAARKEDSAFGETLLNSLRYSSFAILPVSAALFLFATPIIRIMFERGAFSAVDTARTALAVQALTIGLWSTTCHSMVIRAFIARRDTLTATLIGIGSLAVSVPMALVLMGPMVQSSAGTAAAIVQHSQEALGSVVPLMNLKHAGLGMAASLASLAAFGAALTVLLRRERLDLKPFLTSTLKSAASSAAAFLAVLYLFDPASLPLLPLTAALLLGVAVFIVTGFLLKNRELQETFRLLRRLNVAARLFGRQRPH